MKRKTKILLGTLIPLGAIAITIGGVVGGLALKDKKMIESISNETVNIFTKGLCPIYRETFKTRKVCDYLKDLVSSWGYSVTEDTDYPSVEQKTADTSGNLIYDIPATKGCEGWQGITLQGHMDMVCSYDKAKEPSGHDWSKGVDIVQEGNILHSRDYLTNIGADNGAGLAMILALTKYQNKFTHGPIRVLITADEEDGDSGASVIDSNKLKYARVINVDNTTPGEIVKSCAGTYGTKYEIPIQWTDVTDSYQQFNVTVFDIDAPHSAEINKNTVSAVKLAFEFLNKLAKEANVEFLELNINTKNNCIPSAFSLCFATDKQDASTWIENELNSMKQKYPHETKMDFLFNELPEKAKVSLSKEETNKLINLFAPGEDIAKDKIPFGIIKWLDNEQTKISTSSNISPFILLNNESTLKVETLTRSCYAEEQETIGKSIETNIKNVYPSTTSTTSITPPWEYKETVPLVDLIAKGFNKYKVSTKISDSHGWLECAFFAKANADAQIASIGVKVVNEHKINEYTDISTYPNVIKTIIYTLQNIK